MLCRGRGLGALPRRPTRSRCALDPPACRRRAAVSLCSSRPALHFSARARCFPRRACPLFFSILLPACPLITLLRAIPARNVSPQAPFSPALHAPPLPFSMPLRACSLRLLCAAALAAAAHGQFKHRGGKGPRKHEPDFDTWAATHGTRARARTLTCPMEPGPLPRPGPARPWLDRARAALLTRTILIFAPYASRYISRYIDRHTRTCAQYIARAACVFEQSMPCHM